MDIEQITALKLRITNVEALDPITVILEDLDVGKGKIIIECYGKSWSAFWPAMSDRTIAQFFTDCNADYLISNLCGPMDSTEPDYDAFLPKVRRHILGWRRINLISELAARELYNIENWADYVPQHPYDDFKCPQLVPKSEFEILDLHSVEIPTQPKSSYEYMVRIISAVQSALAQSGLALKAG